MKALVKAKTEGGLVGYLTNEHANSNYGQLVFVASDFKTDGFAKGDFIPEQSAEADQNDRFADFFASDAKAGGYVAGDVEYMIYGESDAEAIEAAKAQGWKIQ